MLWQRHWNDPTTLLDSLREEILRREQLAPSYPSHNVGGWRTPEDLLDSPCAAITQLRDRITRAVAQVDSRPFALRAWAVVNRAGSYHKRHIHGNGAIWSGIYYVAPGDAPSARTCFELPEGAQHITPEPSLMVVFPASLWHSVEPHHGTAPRITIAFDARLDQRLTTRRAQP